MSRSTSMVQMARLSASDSENGLVKMSDIELAPLYKDCDWVNNPNDRIFCQDNFSIYSNKINGLECISARIDSTGITHHG